jgi:hypothetical protein
MGTHGPAELHEKNHGGRAMAIAGRRKRAFQPRAGDQFLSDNLWEWQTGRRDRRSERGFSLCHEFDDEFSKG